MYQSIDNAQDKGFWNKLKRPIVGLAPMDGVTDAPMRYITAKYGHPDVIFTEFVNVSGLERVINSNKLSLASRNSLLRHLKYDEIERPVVAQIFGGEPEAFFEVSKMIVKMGFDGVDINMGCPAKKVAGRGEGAGLIKNPQLAAKIIAAVKKGVEGRLPVSVKTRIGYEEADSAWWEFLAGQDLAAVTIHGRTFKQLYQGQADWEAIGRAAKIIKSDKTVFLGNGDIDSRQKAKDISEKYGTDGVLIGRAAGGNPFVFGPRPDGRDTSPLRNSGASSPNLGEEKAEKLLIAVEHCRKFEEIFPQDRFFIMRKHLAWYARGFENASELRNKLVLTNSADEAEGVINEFLER